MFSTPVRKMIERHGYPVLDADGLDDFLAGSGDTLLFFTGEAGRFPETDDVAMILPELLRAFEGRLTAAVVAWPDQPGLQMRYGFREWPTLVFLRHGAYLGAISRVQDWAGYLERTARLLASAPGRPPAFPLPVSTDGGCARTQGDKR